MKIKATNSFLILILFFSSCSSKTESFRYDSVNWQNLQLTAKPVDDLCPEISPQQLDLTGEEVKHDFSYGLAQALYPKDLANVHKIAGGTYWVGAGDQLNVNWLFWYPKGNKEPIDLRLFVLFNEQQLTNALPQPGRYNDLHLERGEQITTIPIRLPFLAPGVHTIVAIAISSPQNDPDEYGTVDVISSRMTLIAEPSPSPFRDIDFVYLPAEGSIKNGDPGMAIELTLTDEEERKNGIRVWNWPEPRLSLQPGVPARFYALAGYEDVKNLDVPSLEPLKKSFFALLLFVDYQQIEIIPNQKVLYGVVDMDNAYARIPIELPLLAEGKHQILALRIDTPGVPYCLLRSPSQDRILPFGIYGRLVGINVLSPE